MIHGLTPRGGKDLILRGWLGPRGLKGFIQARVTTPSGDKQIWDGSSPPTPTVTLSPTDVTGSVTNRSLTGSVDTAVCTANVTGGSAPYSYSWTPVSDDGGATWTVLNPGSVGTAFHAAGVTDVSDAVFRCTVTDARGAVSTADVNATAIHYSL